MEHKRGSGKVSPTNTAPSPPQLPILSEWSKDQGLLEKSFTVTATRDQCHSGPARLLLRHNLSNIFLMLTVF